MVAEAVDGGAGARGGRPGRFVRLESRVVRLECLRLVEGQAGDARAARRASASVVPKRALADLDGERCVLSERFWTSIFHRYRFSASTFRYFPPTEVFRRIHAVSGDHELRLTVERRSEGPPVALGASRPATRLATLDDIEEIARSHDGGRVAYADGVARCMFVPRSGLETRAIGPDAFCNRFTIAVPLDGLGHARIHVGLLRLLCENGLVALNRVFASELPASRDPRHTIARAVACYDQADGFTLLRERLLASQASWASVREVRGLYRQLMRVRQVDGPARSQALEVLDRVSGRIHEHYGITNIDSLPLRRQRLLPAKCRVYDLLNLASELTSHQFAAADTTPLQAWIGTTVADEFDLEGTAGDGREFADLFLGTVPDNSPARR